MTSSLADNFGNGLSHFFPCYLKGDVETLRLPRANLTKAASDYLGTFSQKQPTLFFHTTAVVHSPTYRKENAGALRQDWPRIPLPDQSTALLHSAALGERLAALLNPETPVEGVTEALHPEFKVLAGPRRADGKQIATTDFALTADWGREGQGGACMPGNGKTQQRPWTAKEREVIAAAAPVHQLTEAQVFELWGDAAVDVYLNAEAYWAAVPVRVWEYTLGGYQVLKKWLSYREQALLGRALTVEEVREVSAIVRRIAAILLMRPALDANYADIRDNAWPWPKKGQVVPMDEEDDAA